MYGEQMPKINSLKCDWCSKKFQRQSAHGPEPKFCQGPCRQISWQSHQKGMKVPAALVPKVLKAAQAARKSPDKLIADLVKQALK